MGSNYHYSIDLNEDHNHQEQPFYYTLGSSTSILHHNHHQVPSNSSSSSSSISSLSSYLPFFISSQEDQHVAYNNNTYQSDHLHLSQPLKAKMIVANGGSSSSTYDHMVPKKETRLKLTIRKKDHEDQTDPLYQNPTKPEADSSDKWLMSPKMRLIKKSIINNYKQAPTDQTNNNNHKAIDHYPLNHKTNLEKDLDEDLNLKKVLSRTTASTMENRYNTINENGYGNNNGVIRVCSDCNTTKTPLWRSGPRGPKSLCNACGIRQRKARRAALAAAAAAGDREVVVGARIQPLPLKKKLQAKKKRSNFEEKYNRSPPVKAKKSKIKEEEDEDMEAETVARDSEISKSTTSSNSSSSSNKLCFDDLTIMLSKSSAYQQMFPQDEKEAAILLMALSYGMVHT